MYLTDFELLLVILAGFYLWECASWVRPGCLLFLSQLGLRFRPHALEGRAFLRNDHGGLLLGNLLPLGTSFLCQQWPISLSPRAVAGYVSQATTTDGRPDQTCRAYAHDDVHSVTVEGSQIHVNGKMLVRTCSPALARRLATLIERLTALPEDRRAGAIEQALEEATDVGEIRTKLGRARTGTAALQVACTLLFGYLFLFVPVSLFLDLRWNLFDYLLSYFALLGLVLTAFVLAHRALFPGDPGARRRQLILMLLSPADAMHARDRMVQLLFSTYHPLALAQALCPRAVWQPLAEHVLRDLRHPLEPVLAADDPLRRETEAWQREKLTERLTHLVREAGLDPAEAFRPPAAPERESRSYCPRCLGEYVLAEGSCHICGGIPLLSLGRQQPDAPEKARPRPGRGA